MEDITPDVTLQPRKMFWLCLVFLAFLSVRPLEGAIRGDADSFVTVYNVATDCQPGMKNTRHLKTGAAIFYFDERQVQSLNLEDFMCHYELETLTDYGFHVYFDQMYLSDLGLLQNPCLDFVQFGR